MKYYSEKLNELFDSEEELNKAEELVCDIEDVDDNMEEVSERDSNKEKEALSNAVVAADKELEDATTNYDSAKRLVEKLSKEYLEKVDSIMKPAELALNEAKRHKKEALYNFNKEFGTFSKIYTGEDAAKEFMKLFPNFILDDEKFFKKFWNF